MKRFGQVFAACVLALLCAAPTAGDIGGCGDKPVELSPLGYSAARKRLECDRCRECSLATGRCRRACDPKAPGDVDLPATCRPLLHDSEVCERALLNLSCADFADAVDDVSPRAPQECLFCRQPPDAAPPSFLEADVQVRTPAFGPSPADATP